MLIRWTFVPALLIVAAFAAPALAQQSPPSDTDNTPPPVAAPAPKKKPSKPKPAAAVPAPTTAPTPAGAAAAAGGAKPTLLGQYGEWGAYTASPGGKKVCFAIAKPSSSETTPPNRPRNPSFMFISTRPADKISNEVSIIVGYPFKPNSEATAEIGTTSFALSTQQDGAWVKNETEEAHMVEALRAGQSVILKGVSAKGTKSADTFSLRGLAQALDRSGQECK